MVIQAGRIFGFEKTIRQGRAVRLADDRNEIKLAFLAGSKETPPDEKRFFQISLEDNSKNIRTAEKELQDKVR